MLRALAVLAFALIATLTAPASVAQSAACVDGTAGGYACDRIDLVAHFTPQELGAPPEGACPSPYPGLCANDIWGWEDSETGRRYAIVGLAVGTAFVDVTTPSAPVRLGMLPTATVPSSWRPKGNLGASKSTQNCQLPEFLYRLQTCRFQIKSGPFWNAPGAG